MSALGQKQLAVQKVMSALPPKADMCGATSDVRFVPIADIQPAFAIQLLKKLPPSIPLMASTNQLIKVF